VAFVHIVCTLYDGLRSEGGHRLYKGLWTRRPAESSPSHVTPHDVIQQTMSLAAGGPCPNPETLLQ